MSETNWLASEIPTDFDTSPTFYDDVRSLCIKAQRLDLVAKLSKLDTLADVKAALLEAVSVERLANPSRFTKPKPAAKVTAPGPQAIAATRSAPAPKPQPTVNRVAGHFTHAEILQHAAAESALLRRLPADLQKELLGRPTASCFI